MGEDTLKKTKAETLPRQGQNCPFMDTIHRQALDFDFEKICSVTLSKQNVYACLVCGVFYGGRSKITPAFFHSIDTDHHLFLNLASGAVYCLPDGYQVDDPSLDDIKHALDPKYSADEIKAVVSRETYSVSLKGVTFIPGRIGINNLGRTDGFNAVIQCLYAVPGFVEFFLDKRRYEQINSKLVSMFGELTRKFFNPKSFKGQISAQEYIQEVDRASNGLFQIGKGSDPIDFFIWVLNKLHRELSKKKKSIISDIFQGVLLNESGSKKLQPFFCLSVDLPATPLYRGEDVEEFIPQVPLTDLLYNFLHRKNSEGESTADFSVFKFPKFLVVHIKRYIENEFRAEKNPTIVNFPIRNLDLTGMGHQSNLNDLEKTELSLLKNTARERWGSNNTKFETISQSVELFKEKEKEPVKYRLVGNIVHEGEERLKGSTKAFVLHRANNKWYEAHDLNIEETMAQLVTVSESYIQFWEKMD